MMFNTTPFLAHRQQCFWKKFQVI